MQCATPDTGKYRFYTPAALSAGEGLPSPTDKEVGWVPGSFLFPQSREKSVTLLGIEPRFPGRQTRSHAKITLALIM
jgi:hypothetical protein